MLLIDVSCTAATDGDGAVEVVFNYINSSSVRCQHYAVYDVQARKIICYCRTPYVLARDGVSCIGINAYLHRSSLRSYTSQKYVKIRHNSLNISLSDAGAAPRF